ncbi:hypothetical protein SAMN05421880_11758 [Nitrosomonas nitrosa]|uniref:DUF1508 domain-containing protein n=1 Tax=Nitrosomonas nitrosa TaxID=52442 RepID=A0A1I4R4Q2_9PROT|nr:hypothetical protein [Nitrosomonas nitrosa]SFM46903.1 hypothetical protein SAMN05421880_11758 [Nitrosomonas nitrosa]
MNKPPIISAYIRHNGSGDYELFITKGLALPVHHATYYSRFEARQEANRLGASMILQVRGTAS